MSASVCVRGRSGYTMRKSMLGIILFLSVCIGIALFPAVAYATQDDPQDGPDASRVMDSEQANSDEAPDVSNVSARERLGQSEILINNQSVSETSMYRKIDTVTLRVTRNPHFSTRMKGLREDERKSCELFRGSTLRYAGKIDAGISGLMLQKARFSIRDDGGDLIWSGKDLEPLFRPLTKAVGQRNGVYQLEGNVPGCLGNVLASPQKVTFTLDNTAPQVIDITGVKGDEGRSLIPYEIKDKRYAVYAGAGVQTVSVHLRDMLPEEQRNESDPRTGDALHGNGASGLGGAGVRVYIPAPTDLEGKVIGEDVHIETHVDDNGQIVVPLEQEGFYDLQRITVEAEDHAGNVLHNAGILVKGKSGDTINYDAMVVDVENDNETDIVVEKKSDYADSRVPGYYFRGPVKAKFNVTDRWFPLCRQLSKLSSAMLEGSGGNTSPQISEGISELDWSTVDFGQWKRTGDYTWTLESDDILLKGHDKQVEGKYRIQFAYSGLQHEDTVSVKEYVMDWTAPKLGGITVSENKPVRWNWVFANKPVTVTLTDIYDAVSGICSPSATGSSDSNDCVGRGTESVKFGSLESMGSTDGIDGETSNATFAGSTAAGTVSFQLSEDGQRLDLSRTGISLTDAAGNPVDTGALNEYAGVNGSSANSEIKGIAGIAIDLLAPKVDVIYDNNDVRNGKYYKAHRSGTVTVHESNFDFTQLHDADVTVASITIDGRGKLTIPAKAFSNPSGDMKTYMAQFKADEEGAWEVMASYGDPGGHLLEPYHDEFVVDTTAPVLTLAFDNNNVVNGKYYNAARTGKITVVDRNFSDSDSVITVVAKDDSGKGYPGPALGQWKHEDREGGQQQWTVDIPFSGEMHYSMKVEATDLAGNAARPISEPEFVVDLTRPQISIINVENETAYAGTVAPLIRVDDTNLNQKNTTYRLVGARHGQIDIRKLGEGVTDKSEKSSRMIMFKDFERKSDIDDVYTLTAKSVDMAGNGCEVSKTFSVNRFGSTYSFDTNTQNLRGVYLKKTGDVRISEINVSGLHIDQSQVVIAKNDRAQLLGPGDYAISQDEDKGWSRTVYTIPANRFADDGYYRVLLQSMDKAGSLSQNTMDNKNAERTKSAEVNFAIDSTAPSARLLGVDSGSVYYEPEGKDSDIDAKDNMSVLRAELYVDGILAQSWDGNEMLDDKPRYVIPADATAHSVSVKVVDRAGNTAIADYDNIYIASNWWQYALHTPWIVSMMVFMGILSIAAMGGVAILIIGHRRRFAYRSNPFDLSGNDV